jgi:hypothetical protein
MSERKLIEIAKKRIPMKRLFHGREIREAMAELEKFRQQYNEQEFFYGAKVYLQVENYGETYAIVRRPETDKEYEKRMKEEQAAAEAKLRRAEAARIRKEEKARREEAKALAEAEQRRLAEIEAVKLAARKLGLTAKDLGVS